MAVMEVKLPRLLNADFSERARLHPTLLSVPDPLHEVGAAQMTLTEHDPDLTMHDWAELYTIEGSAGLWRVTSMAWTVRRERVITLRQAIDTLSDNVWKAQIDYDGTVPDFLEKLLAQQTTVYWQIGTVDDESDYKKSGINYQRLNELMDEMAGDRPGYAFDYDFTTWPWTLNYKALPVGVTAECRLSRNIDSCRITYDDSELCNRLFLTWSVTETTSDGKSISKTIREYNDLASQAIYGIIEKPADVKEADEPDPDTWAARFLAERKEPRALIEIQGQTLQALTGLAWDRYSRGKQIRAALSDYGVSLTERVANVTHPDALGNPLRVELELSNTLKKFSETIADISKTAKTGSSYSSSAIDQAEVNKENITSHGGRISALGGRMGAAEQKITNIEADIIYIQGTELVSIKSRLVSLEADVVEITGTELVSIKSSLTTIESDIVDINARITSLQTTLATSITTGTLNAAYASISSLTVGGNLIIPNENTFTCGFTTGLFYGPGTAGIDITGHTHGISFAESGSDIVATIGQVSGSNTGTFSITATSTYRQGVAAAYQEGYDDGVASVPTPSISLSVGGYQSGGDFRCWGRVSGDLSDYDYEDDAVYGSARTVSGNPLGVSVYVDVSVGNASYRFTTTI